MRSLYKRAPFVPTIIGANIFVFVLWHLFRSPYGFMPEHFLVSWDAVVQGRPWTLLTSVFSHTMALHIFFNMYALYGFGLALELSLGTKIFGKLYFIAGIAGSIGHIVVCKYLLGSPSLPALGASGAVSGVILVFAMIFPAHRIYIFGLIPLRAIFGAALIVGLDVWGLIEQTQGQGLPIGHGAHLGGAAAGFLYYQFGIKPRLRR